MINSLTKLKLYAYHHTEYNGPKPKMEGHSHNTIELYYVIEGSVNICYLPYTSNQTTTITLYPKEFVIFKPHIYHSINSDVLGLKVYNLELTTSLNNVSPFEYLKSSKYINLFPVAVNLINKWNDILIFSDTQKTAHMLTKFKYYPEKESDTPYFMANLEIDLKRLFLEIIQCSEENIDTSGHNIYIKKALQFIETNYKHDISLKHVAEYLDISVSHLQRLFKYSLNETVLHRLNAIRINKAKQMIIETNIPMSNIAKSVGYNSVQAFNRRFKDLTGFSPTEFKNNEAHKYVRYKNLY